MTLIDAETTPPAPRPITPFDPTLVEVRRARPWLKLTLLVGDAVATAIGWLVATLVLGPSDRSALGTALLVGAAVALTLVVLARNDLYLARVNSVRTAEIAGIARSTPLAAVGVWLVWSAADAHPGLGETVLAVALSFLLVLIGRSVFRVWLAGQRRLGRYCRHVILVGANDEAWALYEILRDHPEFGFTVEAVVGDAEVAEAQGFGSLHQGGVTDAMRVAHRLGADGAIVAVSALESAELNHVTRELMRSGVHVQITSAVRGIDHRRLRAQPIGHEPLFYLEPARLAPWQLAVKRGIDLVLAGTAMLIVLPVVGILALAVRLQDGGPAFFRQERVGRYGRRFEMIKIRTMVVDAEARLAELQAQNQRKGPLFKMDHDPRFTRLGRFLDATSLNELPQLFNVLRGEMSLVGPRPALPRETATFDDALHARHQVRPGITGLWQVEARDNPAFSAYRRYDLFYVENWSVTFDLVILLTTVETVIGRMVRMLRGAPRRAPLG